MKKMILVSLLSFLFGMPAWSFKLSTYPIPLMVESADKGLFIELSKEIAKRAGEKMDVEVTPPKRTIKSFADKQTDAFFPALDVLLPGPAAKSASVYQKVDYIFFKKGSSFKSLADLAGKKVGITMGYPYDKSVLEAKGFVIDESTSDEQNIKKLAMGKIDAFIVEEKTGLKAIELSGEKNIEYVKEAPVSKQDVYYAFQDTPAGKALAAKFSAAIAEIQKDGTMGKIMSQAK